MYVIICGNNDIKCVIWWVECFIGEGKWNNLSFINVQPIEKRSFTKNDEFDYLHVSDKGSDLLKITVFILFIPV